MTANSAGLNGFSSPTSELISQAAPAGAILRFEDAKHWESGHAFLREASRVVEEARINAAAQLSKAQQEGYNAGYEEGLRDALALIAQTKTTVDDYQRNLQVTLSSLVGELLQQIVDEMEPGAAVAAAVRKALPTVDLGGELTLVVSPIVAHKVIQYLSSYLDSEAPSKINLREDPKIASTGCRLESNFGSVDLSLNNQVALLAASLRSAGIGI
jgi:type III secretion protein L